MTSKLARVGGAVLLIALTASGQEHKWAGRTLDETEWRIHEELAMLPFHGVFETLDFELRDKTVVLSGHVIRETVKINAERVIKRLDCVETVINQIEVLPSSRQDDAIRMRVYRAIYETQPLEHYGTRASPSIHIIVKDGTVTLEGAVDSEVDRSAAYLKAVKSAHHVVSNLRIAPEE
jgi:hyperosmotically inducible protein